jgi:ankyrin repeat protein
MGKITFEDAFVLQRILRGNQGIDAMEQSFRAVSEINLKWGTGITIVHFYISVFNEIKGSPNEILTMLKRVGADLESKTKEGRTPLHHAVLARNLEITKALVHLGVKVDEKDVAGCTALFRAVMSFRGEPEYLEIIRFLVASGADINLENNSGHSPKSMVLRIHENIAITNQPTAWDLQPHLKW